MLLDSQILKATENQRSVEDHNRHNDNTYTYENLFIFIVWKMFALDSQSCKTVKELYGEETIA